jgi:hypothetical protein
MSKIWPESQDPRKTQPTQPPSKSIYTRHKEELLKQEQEYREFLDSQKRLAPKPDCKEVHRKEFERRAFLYGEEVIEKALKHRNNDMYSLQDMDNEFSSSIAPTYNSNKYNLWLNEDVQKSDDFDIDAPIPKPREIRTLMKAQTENVIKIQEELKNLSKSLNSVFNENDQNDLIKTNEQNPNPNQNKDIELNFCTSTKKGIFSRSRY